MGAETSARTLPHFRSQPRRPRPDVPVADGQSERPTLGVTARMPVLAGSAIGALAEPPRPDERSRTLARPAIATECSFGRAVGDHPGQPHRRTWRRDCARLSTGLRIVDRLAGPRVMVQRASGQTAYLCIGALGRSRPHLPPSGVVRWLKISGVVPPGVPFASVTQEVLRPIKLTVRPAAVRRPRRSARHAPLRSSRHQRELRDPPGQLARPCARGFRELTSLGTDIGSGQSRAGFTPARRPAGNTRTRCVTGAHRSSSASQAFRPCP